MSCTPSSQATTYIINTKWGESSSVGSLSLALQDLPSFRTLTYRSTPNQRGNFSPALAAVRLYRILQLDVFVFWPCTRTPRRLVDAGIQDIVPSVFTKKNRSTRNQRGNCSPILATVRLYRILQLDVFVF
jgi:hypothetical protein